MTTSHITTETLAKMAGVRVGNKIGRGVVCWTNSGEGLGGIVLVQQGKDTFSVHYGLQVDACLDYGRAAAKLGEAIMHAAACDGHLDNRRKGEA
jgi:hypothetical protein